MYETKHDEQYLVFDLETTPLDFESFSDSQQEYLIRNAKTEEEIENKKFEMALSPLTGSIVCIGLQLMQSNEEGGWDTLQKAAFSTSPIYNGKEYEIIEMSDGHKCYVASEEKIIEDFWTILRKYNRASLVSFNGRNFDAPYIMLRSALHKIRPCRNLMSGTKYNYGQHIDLIDELTFYNPSQYGATRRYNFDFYTRSFGITSPKAEGVDGSKVRELYKNNNVQEIAEYCLRDVAATWDLFLHWKTYLKF